MDSSAIKIMWVVQPRVPPGSVFVPVPVPPPVPLSVLALAVDKVDTYYEVALSLCGTVTRLHPATTMNSDER